MTKFLDARLPLEDRYLCEVVRYLNVHNSLAIRFRNSDNSGEIFYVEFVSVQYYSGPMVWNSVHFEVATPQECATLLRRIPDFKNLTENEISHKTSPHSDGYKLYRSTDQEFFVEIIAVSSRLFTAEEYL